MNKKSRSSNAIKNIIVALLCQAVTFVFSFATRTILINLLGDEYNGLTSFFHNVVVVLSFTELGIGSAIIYALYKPIAENNIEKLKSLMDFYKKFYKILAIVVFVLGILITPVISFFVETDVPLGNVSFYFMIYLGNTAVSYLFVYKSSILNADQRNRTVKLITTIFLILRNIIEIGILLLTHSFVAYLCVQFACTILNNLTISTVANKYYPWLKEKATKLDKVERKGIFDDVKSIFVYRVGGILLNNSASIIMTKIVGVVILGFYSNYYTFISSATALLELVFVAMKGGLGNLNARKDFKASEKFFRECNFLAFILYTICSVGMFVLLDDVVYLWLGPERILGKTVCFAMVANLYIYGMLQGMMIYRNTTGLFRKTKYIILITSIINLVLSISMGLKWGLFGIIIATSIARLATNFWYEPLMLYKKIFNMPASKHFVRQIMYFATTLGSGVITYFVCEKLFAEVTIFSISIKFVLCIAIPSVTILVLYFRTEEFKAFKSRVFGLIKKIKK